MAKHCCINTKVPPPSPCVVRKFDKEGNVIEETVITRDPIPFPKTKEEMPGWQPAREPDAEWQEMDDHFDDLEPAEQANMGEKK